MNFNERPVIKTSRDIHELLSKVWDMDKIELFEEIKVVLLNKANKVLGVLALASGGIDQCSIDIRLLFASALKAAATSIIVAHNHPSGSLTASHADIKITERIKAAGLLLDIKLLDHLIITAEGFTSMADEGLL